MRIDQGEIIEQLREELAELTSDGVEYTSADILSIFDRASVKVLVSAHRSRGKSHHASAAAAHAESPQKKAARTRARNKQRAQRQAASSSGPTPIKHGEGDEGGDGKMAVGE